MTEFVVPPRLVAAAAPDGRDEFRGWLNDLPEMVQRIAGQWKLSVGQPYEPGGQCAWVAPAWDRRGTQFALKLAWRHPAAEGEALALQLARGHGTVELIQAEQTPTTNVLLLESCASGMSLSSAKPEADRDRVIAGILADFWTVPHQRSQFPDLCELCDRWAQELNTDRTMPEVDPGLARIAGNLLRSLSRDPTEQVLLFTDLHGDNVLAAQRSPWLAIDPKPHVGDPAFDLVMHIGTSYERMQTDPCALVARMADLTGTDETRVGLWVFARAVVERPGKPWLQAAVTALAP